ncbi:hypothetical protein D6817_05210 [Candidatus Pacearchaeota archaeon]|nr:MAG: hypothetical protein D6817_05210 [Candidatus Pacearchaeota archaeon]
MYTSAILLTRSLSITLPRHIAAQALRGNSTQTLLEARPRKKFITKLSPLVKQRTLPELPNNALASKQACLIARFDAHFASERFRTKPLQPKN